MPHTKEIRLVHTRFTNEDSTNLTDLSSTVSRQAPLPSSQTLGLTENGNTLTPQITVKWDVPQLYQHIQEVPYGGGHTGGAFFHTTGGVGPTGGQRWHEYPYRTVYYEMDKTLELTYPLPSIETPDLHPAEEEMNVDLNISIGMEI